MLTRIDTPPFSRMPAVPQLITHAYVYCLQVVQSYLEGLHWVLEYYYRCVNTCPHFNKKRRVALSCSFMTPPLPLQGRCLLELVLPLPLRTHGLRHGTAGGAAR